MATIDISKTTAQRAAFEFILNTDELTLTNLNGFLDSIYEEHGTEALDEAIKVLRMNSALLTDSPEWSVWKNLEA